MNLDDMLKQAAQAPVSREFFSAQLVADQIKQLRYEQAGLRHGYVYNMRMASYAGHTCITFLDPVEYVTLEISTSPIITVASLTHLDMLYYPVATTWPELRPWDVNVAQQIVERMMRNVEPPLGMKEGGIAAIVFDKDVTEMQSAAIPGGMTYFGLIGVSVTKKTWDRHVSMLHAQLEALKHIEAMRAARGE